MEMNKQKIASTLKSLRGDRKQQEVAEAIGVSNMAISQYESGERVPSDAIKLKLAAYYGKSVEEIFFTP